MRIYKLNNGVAIVCAASTNSFAFTDMASITLSLQLEKGIFIFFKYLQKKNIKKFGCGEVVYVRTLLNETIKVIKKP